MELDDLKAKTREIKAPGADGAAGGRGEDKLLGAIREADERLRHEARKATPLHAVAGLAFLAGGVLSVRSVSPAGSSSLHLVVLGGVFLLLAALLAAKARSLARMDYSKPVKTFLAEAERRYRFLRPSELVYSVPLLLLLAATGGRVLLDRLVPRYVGVDGRGVVIALYAVFFLAVCGMGYYFTYQNWQRANGRIWADIRRTREEME